MMAIINSRCSWMTMTILIQIIVFSGCQKQSDSITTDTVSYLAPAEVMPLRLIENLSYGPDASQKMDVILPKGRNTTSSKIIVLVHGGQWTTGDKSHMGEYITVLSAAFPQFAFASINYRLVNGNSILIADAEKDITRALAVLQSLTDSFSVSKDMVILGESAGGHLALLSAYKNKSRSIRGVIGIKSPTDLQNWYDKGKNKEVRPILEFITGGTPTTAAMTYFKFSPVNYVHKDVPYTLLIHGDADGFVEVSQANELANMLSREGAKYKLAILPGESHAYSPATQQTIYKIIVEVLSEENFFK